MPPAPPVILPFSLAVAALTLAGQQTVLAEAKIGVAAVVKNDVRGKGGALAVGSSVFANERIRTGDAAAAQFMFADKTVLNMGPKAELLLDKYVYNPDRGTGQVVMSAVQGIDALCDRRAEPDQLFNQDAGRDARHSRHDRRPPGFATRNIYRRAGRDAHDPDDGRLADDGECGPVCGDRRQWREKGRRPLQGQWSDPSGLPRLHPHRRDQSAQCDRCAQLCGAEARSSACRRACSIASGY